MGDAPSPNAEAQLEERKRGIYGLAKARFENALRIRKRKSQDHCAASSSSPSSASSLSSSKTESSSSANASTASNSDDCDLRKKAKDAILREAKNGARRAESMGAQGWKKPTSLNSNKRFLANMLRSAELSRRENEQDEKGKKKQQT